MDIVIRGELLALFEECVSYFSFSLYHHFTNFCCEFFYLFLRRHGCVRDKVSNVESWFGAHPHKVSHFSPLQF